MKDSQKSVKLGIERYYRRVLRQFAARKGAGRRANTDRVVIVKFDGLGDFVLFLSAAKQLRELYKDRELVLICSEQAAAIAGRCGIFDKVEFFRKSELALNELKRAKLRLKEYECDILLHLSVARGIHSEMVAALIHANKKITVRFDMSFSRKKLTKLLKGYDEVIEVDRSAMSLEQNAQIVKSLGGGYEPKVYEFENIGKSTLPLPDNYFVLVCGASAPWKQYPQDIFRRIAQKLCADTHFACVLVGDERDEIDEDRICGNFVGECYSYIGKTDVWQLVQLIAGAKFVIGNDTVAIHIAASCNVKSLCVSSAVSADRFYPYVVGNTRPIVLRRTPPCRGCSFEAETNLACVGGPQTRTLPPCFSSIGEEEIYSMAKSLCER